MTRDEFIDRLIELQTSKGVSARVMSQLSGLGESYISNLMNSDYLPNMAHFFAICDYLQITPKEFFDVEPNERPKASILLNEALSLPDDQMDLVINVIRAIKK